MLIKYHVTYLEPVIRSSENCKRFDPNLLLGTNVIRRLKAWSQRLMHYIRTRDVQYWTYRIAGPTRLAFVANFILLAVFAYTGLIPPEVEPAFIFAWFTVQMLLAAVTIGAQMMTYNRSMQIFVGIIITFIFIAVGALLLF
ncbi:MAG: hypothetical protein ACFE7R_10450 [Candidatus Hodarchaeota archaeon]